MIFQLYHLSFATNLNSQLPRWCSKMLTRYDGEYYMGFVGIFNFVLFPVARVFENWLRFYEVTA